MNNRNRSPVPVRIVLLGFGNVAQAVLSLLASRREWLQQELGVQPVISGIGTRSRGFFLHPTGIDVQQLVQTEHLLATFITQTQEVSDAATFIQAGKVAGASLLLELTTLQPHNGEPALTHIRTALQAGMDVITANKGPIAYAQAELQALARQRHVDLRFESTVMDGLPLINLAQFTLQAVDIYAFRALLNTTSSLVLSLIEQGSSLGDAIAEAQRLGITEADPWYDLDGWDAAMKTTILANTLLAGNIMPTHVQREGIRSLSPDAIRAAARQGNPIRLVSTAKRVQNAILAEVRPQEITAHDILHVGQGTTSVISLETEAMGTITLVEHEPVVKQTAYGVLSDMITILRHKHP